MTALRPVGVRAVTGVRAGLLTWVDAAGHTVEHGSRVVVRDGSDTWLGEVIVLPAQVVEAVPLSGLPTLARAATDADPWPEPPVRAGRALLDSLSLPAELVGPTDG